MSRREREREGGREGGREVGGERERRREGGRERSQVKDKCFNSRKYRYIQLHTQFSYHCQNTQLLYTMIIIYVNKHNRNSQDV